MPKSHSVIILNVKIKGKREHTQLEILSQMNSCILTDKTILLKFFDQRGVSYVSVRGVSSTTYPAGASLFFKIHSKFKDFL